MTDLEEARAALTRSQQAGEQVATLGAKVSKVMGSLNGELERNGFSVRLARLYGLEDPRK